MGVDRSSDSQPTPIPNDLPCAHDKVVADMEARKQLGIRKYGTPLQPHNGRDSLLDAYEEVLDLSAYLANRILEREVKREELPPFRAIRRADGDFIMGEYAWMTFENNDWVCAEEDTTDEVVWEVVEMRPVLVERRTYRQGVWAEDPDREMCEDCGEDHIGTGSVCEA